MATHPAPGLFPSVDRIARFPQVEILSNTYGRRAVVEAIRAVLDKHRLHRNTLDYRAPEDEALAREVSDHLQERGTARLRRVFNLTGTVLHTNLGRAQLSSRAIEHAGMAMRETCNLEFDLEDGGRGERDNLVEELLLELTGAEAATVVNNNAAAVVLVLAALAHQREVILSRGEMIEIGGAFRMPDVMRSAGTLLVEVGTTNRTHARDYDEAIGSNTAALMKVHTSNYKITGFVAEVPESELAAIAHARDLPLIVDLGAGSLIDLAAFGLPPEPVVREVLAKGADVVTFSGDKLLGGPQAGVIVGKKEFIDRIKRHPLKRALRVSKLILAALEGTLLAYRTPDLVTSELPTLRLLTRPITEIEAAAQRLQPHLAAALGAQWQVDILPVSSQVGSGSLPVEVIPSVALACRAGSSKSGAALNALAKALRDLPIPILGRIAEDALMLDLRCLEDEPAILEQFRHLANR
jgi:L-seryl-tRNA(Ser) seleniumtransferase